MVEQLQKAWTAPPALLACLAHQTNTITSDNQASVINEIERSKKANTERGRKREGANLTPTRPGRALAKRWLGGLVCQQWRQCRKKGRKARWGE
jgi:hypothetical protein